MEEMANKMAPTPRRSPVPTVRVKLVKTIRLPPSHSAVVDAKLSANVSTNRPLLLEDCT